MLKNVYSLKLLLICVIVSAAVVVTFIAKVQRLDITNAKRARRQQRLNYDYDEEGLANKHHFTIDIDSALQNAIEQQAELDMWSTAKKRVRWIAVDSVNSNLTQSQMPLQYLSFAYRDIEVPRIRLFYVGNILDEPVFCWMVSVSEDNLVQLSVSVVRRTEFYRGDRRFVDGTFAESGVADCWPTFRSVRPTYVKLAFSRWPVRTHLTPKRAILRAIERGELVRVTYPPTRNATQKASSNSKAVQVQNNSSQLLIGRLVVIHKILHGAVPYYDVVEWFEWLRLFAADGVCIAAYHDLASPTLGVLQFYESRGLAQVWSFSRLRGSPIDGIPVEETPDSDDVDAFDETRFAQTRRLVYNEDADADSDSDTNVNVDELLSDRDKSIIMQGASLNLCAWSNTYRFEFATVFDLDEVLLPRIDATFSGLLDRVNDNRSTSFIFSNLHFLKELQSSAADVKQQFETAQAEPFPRSLARTVRAGDLNHAWKSISRLPDCRLLHCHICIEPDYTSRVYLNESVAALHHYSFCHSFQTDVCKRLGDVQRAVVDSSALRHRNVVVKRIETTLNQLNMTTPSHYPSLPNPKAKPACCI